jgi:2-oxoglutarate ferredoxin oxidoreductase subunit gamma
MLYKSVFSGFGGQGVLMMGYLLAVSAMKEGRHVTYLPAYGAEVRGGTANCTIVISDEEIASPVASTPDFGVVLNKPSLTKYEGMLRSDGLIIINSSLVDSVPSRPDIRYLQVPANTLARELGNDRAMNMIMLGAFAAGTGVTTLESLINGLGEIAKGRKADVIKMNTLGLKKGAEFANKGA